MRSARPIFTAHTQDQRRKVGRSQKKIVVSSNTQKNNQILSNFYRKGQKWVNE